MREVGFGVIGAGAVSGLHKAAIANCAGARLAAVADVSEERARALAGDDAAYYTDYREMLNSPDVDVVCVCTPTGMRGPICIDVARAGKHVLAEKPLEVTLERADAVIEECDRAGVKLAVIFQVRFMPGVLTLHKAVSEGRLGKLIMGDAYVKWHRSQEYYDSSDWRGTWAMDGGGVLMNQAIHYIDLLQWMMGPVESVFGHAVTLVRERIEVEDTAAACIRFANGALGTIEACTSAWKGTPPRLEIRGEKGVVVLEDGQITLWEVEGEERPEEEHMDLGSGASDPSAITSVGHQAQISDLVQAINEGREPVVGGREARKAIEIITGIYRSASSGAAVTLPL